MITLAAIPSYLDVADTAFAQDQPVKASTFQQLAHNAKFAMVRREPFVGAFTHGQTIAAPKSAIDGYQYSYSEITFWWTRNFSYSPTTKKPSGGGCILQWNDSVNAAGVVSMETDYYIDGGAESPTNDGQLIVYLFCQRAITMPGGSVVSWADVEDPDLAGGQFMDAADLLQLNRNIRYAALRKEFFVQTLYNGQTAALPVSPVDGYAYARSELIYAPSMIASWSSGGSRSGSGTVRQFGCVVGGMQGVTMPATAGQVASFVNYYVNGAQETLTNDGKILVLIVATRSQGSAPIPPAVRVQPPPANSNSFGKSLVAVDPSALIDGQPASSVVLGSVTGSQQNLTPDSDLKYPSQYWPTGNGISIGYGGGFASGRTLVLNCNADVLKFCPNYFPVSPGQQITLSANIAANSMTAGYALVGLDWAGRGSTIFELDVNAGAAEARIPKTFTVPAGVYLMRVYYGQWALTGSPAGTAYINQIQVEIGPVMTAYKSNALDTLTDGLPSGLNVQHPDGTLGSQSLGEIHKRSSLGFDTNGNLVTGTPATPVASLDTGASRANTAIDAGNVLVAGSADFARLYRNQHLGYMADDPVSGRLARLSKHIEPGGVAVWILLGTWTFAADGRGHSLQVEAIGGSGYNTNLSQQSHATIFVRSSNAVSGAPNISGATWIQHGAALLLAVKVEAHGLSTLQTNNVWDIYAEVAANGDAHWSFYCDPADSFAVSGAGGSDPGAASATVVVATGQSVLDQSGNIFPAVQLNGKALPLGSIHDRVNLGFDSSGRLVTGTANTTVANIDSGASRANTAIDANGKLQTGTAATAIAQLDSAASRANAAIDSGNVLVAAAADFARGYTNQNLDHMPNGAGRILLENVNADGSLHASTALAPQGSVLTWLSNTVSTSEVWNSGTSNYTVTPSATAASGNRPDGAPYTVAASSGPGVGIAANTTCYCYPRVNVSTLAIDWQGGYTATGSATLLQNMYSDGYRPLVDDPHQPFMAYTTGGSGGTGGGSGGGGGGVCPADDQIVESLPWLPFTPPRWVRGRFRLALYAKTGGFVRRGDGSWGRIAAARSEPAILQYIDVGGERYHTTQNHWWLRRGGDYRAALPIATGYDENWMRQWRLEVGRPVEGGIVEYVSGWHGGLARVITLVPGRGGDRSYRMGRTVTHNISPC